MLLLASFSRTHRHHHNRGLNPGCNCARARCPTWKACLLASRTNDDDVDDGLFPPNVCVCAEVWVDRLKNSRLQSGGTPFYPPIASISPPLLCILGSLKRGGGGPALFYCGMSGTLTRPGTGTEREVHTPCAPLYTFIFICIFYFYDAFWVSLILWCCRLVELVVEPVVRERVVSPLAMAMAGWHEKSINVQIYNSMFI